ncbi:family 4 glycosyl hydrolase [Cellulosilyticum sp. I15G10I2]|uniref:family 4 glycosyl hydrolase n=1 Tax=Cellulosilyticum sp. I15G10I2 TaxID=1892843 RepID=UPI00085CC132|nr:alpha-glucosidase/alpha-galactosidase [Cellulosilyticum sp. I15G10I2]
MIRENNKVKDIQIAYIGGGSRNWAWTFMKDLALEAELSGTIRLYDIDKKAAKANEIIGNKISQKENAVGKWEYKALASIEETLTGADFVIISVLPGDFKEMASDVHTPEKYGIYQSVGDTVGPGGIIRAMRTIPMFFEIAENIKKYSPDAWVINYTNPMTICVKALYAAFPEIKAYGCCHEVFGTQTILKKALEEMRGLKDVERHEIRTNALGINHFTWIDRATYKDIDLLPIYKEFVDKHYEEGYQVDEEHWLNSVFKSSEKVKFDLFRRHGLIAAAGDRHLAEFVPSNWYLKDPETVAKWQYKLTPVSFRIENREALKEKSRKYVDGMLEIELENSGEEGIAQIKALVGLNELVTNVNLPNKGQMAGVPFDAVVETNALFQAGTVRPIIAGGLPREIESITLRHVEVQEGIIEAALAKDMDKAFKAFSADVQVSTLNPDDARALFDEMVENTKHYLSYWNI